MFFLVKLNVSGLGKTVRRGKENRTGHFQLGFAKKKLNLI